MVKHKEKVNKSLEIRSYIAAHPEAKPREIVAALRENGIDVSAAFVSTLKSNDKRKGKPGLTRPAGKSSRLQGTHDGLASLLVAKELVNQTGSLEAARRSLDALEKILG